MTNYILLGLSIVLATSNNVLLHGYGNQKRMKCTFLFNFYTAIVWIVMLFGLLGTIPKLTVETVGYGVLYGVFQGLFLFFKMKAMGTGSISVTTLVGNCSLIISTLLGVVIWQEQIQLFQIIGVVLLIVAMYLCTQTSKGEKSARQWKYYCAGFFVVAGTVGVVMKIYSKAVPEEVGSVILISSLVMAIMHLIFYFAFSVKDKEAVGFTKRDYIFIILCGLVSCGYNRLNSYLTGALASIIFYPIFNGTTILCSTLGGKLIFKERFTKRQIAGFVIGIIALALAGNVMNIFS